MSRTSGRRPGRAGVRGLTRGRPVVAAPAVLPPLAALAARRGSVPKGRLEARLGYGFAAFGGRFTATPELGLVLARSHRRYGVGWRLGPARRERVALQLPVEAVRREAANRNRPPEHGLGVRATAGW